MINKKILLIGGSGNLGSCIKKSKIFKKLISPKRKSLNLLNKKKIGQILSKNKFDLIINCASMARMKMCEKDEERAVEMICQLMKTVGPVLKDPSKAYTKIESLKPHLKPRFRFMVMDLMDLRKKKGWL